MMDADDPRVQELQKLAWGLQSLVNKPGGKLPEACKRSGYQLASKAIGLCSDVGYTEEADFISRAAQFKQAIEVQKVELQNAEEAEKQRIVGKCFRAVAGGNGAYAIGERAVATNHSAVAEVAAMAASPEVNNVTAEASRRRHQTQEPPTLSSGYLARFFVEAPEMLRLRGVGITDANIEELCEGLRIAGMKLTALDLSNNAIADIGVQQLVSALACGACPKLCELWLGGNAFGELGAQMVSSGLCALRRNLVVHMKDSDGPGASSCEATSNALVQQQESPVEVPINCSAPDNHPEAAAKASVKVIEDHDGSNEAVLVRVVVTMLEGQAESADDLELDVSEWRLVVRMHSDEGSAQGAVIANVELPCAVETKAAKAAFSRRRRTLTVALTKQQQFVA